MQAALRNGADIAAEFFAAGLCGEEDYAAAAAEWLGLRREAPQKDDRIVGDAGEEDGPIAGALRTCDRYLRTRIFLTPRLESLSAVRQTLAGNPALASRCRVATVSALRRHRIDQRAEALSNAARLGLSADRLGACARITLTGLQGAGVGAGGLACALLLALYWIETLGVLRLAAAAGFGLWIALRFCAAFGRHPEPASASFASSKTPPIYSVVVALHREQEIVPDLVANLDRLDWPKSRLDIILVCEADDPATIAACRRATAGRAHYLVLAVPPSEPRTKPKALNFALPLARGEFLVLYDAEDDPAPGQLREAWRSFEAGEPALACLQAPLVIRNHVRTALTAVFAMEYAGLFRAFLPWLARHALPIPLGGTSNHFRVEALRAVGGWDSHNVTEDADLGLRLAREGYRIGTLTLPTLEDAPETVDVWLPQRTRWLKGWMQTYLVHMRNPLALWRAIGARRFFAFQLIFHGIITSALLMPVAAVLVAMTGIAMARNGGAAGWSDPLFAAECLILVGGVVSFLSLAWRGFSRREFRETAFAIAAVPLVWALVSFAAWRALFQLMLAPHVWEKTPHGLAARRDKGDARHRVEPVVDLTANFDRAACEEAHAVARWRTRQRDRRRSLCGIA